MPREVLRAKLRELPALSGVYLFKDLAGRTLYVGKAGRIRGRVASHLAPASDDPKQERLLRAAVDVEFIVTDSELEALTLENSLIKQSHPKFNVKLRDDKNYPYLKLSVNETFPRLQLVRGVKKDGTPHFGPYVPASTARRTQVLVYRNFGLRPCNVEIDGSWDRPCLYYDIGECAGPCVAELCDQRRYAEVVTEARLFLEGKGEDLREDLKAKMQLAAEEQQYERAAHYRDLLRTVQANTAAQKMATTDLRDRDVFAFHRQAGRVALQLFMVRRGLVVDRKQFFWDAVGKLDDAELMETTLQQYYHGERLVPPEICVPVVLPGADVIEEWLKQKRGTVVRLHVPQRGHKRRLLELVRSNAELAFKHRYERSANEQGAYVLGELLDLDAPPRVLECIDVSNLQGRQVVASVVCYRDGEPEKSGYKRFRIRGLEGQDDFFSIAQVVRRHFRSVLAGERAAPDLLLIDGGRGQLSAASMELEAVGMPQQAVAAIEKSEEKLYVRGRSTPIYLTGEPAALHLVQRVRDEAHRFAVTYHRRWRQREALTSELESIPGIGPVRRRALLRKFGSLQGVRQASEKQLAAVVGIQLAAALRDRFV